ncbi:MAG: four helix bundle protein [gamma proteobacterium symbiont of Ctena orbiculata]|nr:MAG: four helix bundle protein [gamma proteobacterium symbiont of Ctena orbiculata]PVV07654.1 MAG: four helix bundle protein [gamma proteobacterium symbiont of Ctena orbiculata]PVV19242.1 MAG: four helix bundle protein [gamma proteobacterium symbiont of Ctena orbiculata]
MNEIKHISKRKGFEFAVRVVNLARHLQREKKEFVLSKQVLRSGTSIGANIEEARAGESRKDFKSKMSVASKEARETLYWLRLLKETKYLEQHMADSLIRDCEELVSLLTSIVKTTTLASKA